jgi:hypothetical protein
MNQFEEKDLTESTLREVYKQLSVKGFKIEEDGFDDEIEIDSDILIKMLEEPVPFEINDDGELCVVIDDEMHVLDPKRNKITDIAEQERKLLAALPKITWDIYWYSISY